MTRFVSSLDDATRMNLSAKLWNVGFIKMFGRRSYKPTLSSLLKQIVRFSIERAIFTLVDNCSTTCIFVARHEMHNVYLDLYHVDWVSTTLFPCDLIEVYEYESWINYIYLLTDIIRRVFPGSLGLTLGLAPHSRDKLRWSKRWVRRPFVPITSTFTLASRPKCHATTHSRVTHWQFVL